MSLSEPQTVREACGGMTGKAASCPDSVDRAPCANVELQPGARPCLSLRTGLIISHRVQSSPAMASISCFLSRGTGRYTTHDFPTVTQQEEDGWSRRPPDPACRKSIVKEQSRACVAVRLQMARWGCEAQGDVFFKPDPSVWLRERTNKMCFLQKYCSWSTFCIWVELENQIVT